MRKESSGAGCSSQGHGACVPGWASAPAAAAVKTQRPAAADGRSGAAQCMVGVSAVCVCLGAFIQAQMRRRPPQPAHRCCRRGPSARQRRRPGSRSGQPPLPGSVGLPEPQRTPCWRPANGRGRQERAGERRQRWAAGEAHVAGRQQKEAGRSHRCAQGRQAAARHPRCPPFAAPPRVCPRAPAAQAGPPASGASLPGRPAARPSAPRPPTEPPPLRTSRSQGQR